MSTVSVRSSALLTGLVWCFIASFLAFAGAARSATFTRGFSDDVWFNAGWQAWMPRTVSSGAKAVALEIDWDNAEPSPPTRGSDPTSPTNPAYNFAYVDSVVRRFRGTGIQLLFLVTDAPRWAQGAGGTTAEYASGGFRPNDAALREFMTALARRYSGGYPDPEQAGSDLPRVAYFQAWAEANMAYKLSPQWTRSGGRWFNIGAVIYRDLLNAFYTGVKAGDPTAKVVFTGLESYGNLPGGPRARPVAFLRSVLCLNAALAAQRCPDPAHFDILASDPYDVDSPTTAAINPDDASAPDLGKLARVLGAAEAQKTVLPASRRPLWVTEFGYESDPPDSYTVSTYTQARWLEESFYVFWREGVHTVFWYLLRDRAGSVTTGWFSGVYLHDGSPKPALTAYRFPLVVMADGTRAQVWGIAPRNGTVRVQRLSSGEWHTILTYRRAAGAVFDEHLPLAAHGSYRAVAGPQTSLVWKY
jgi:hypothetical protein